MQEDYPASSPHGLPVSAAGGSPPGRRNRVTWRAAGAGAAGFGTPLGIATLHPAFGEIVAIIELAMVLTVIGTALFGSQALSERAFRLMRWFTNKPEPQAPDAQGKRHKSQ